MTKKNKEQELKKELKIMAKGLSGILATILAFLLVAFLFQLSWNYIIPQLLETPILLTFWQAVALKFTLGLAR